MVSEICPYERVQKRFLGGKAPELRPYENEQKRLLSGKTPELRPYERTHKGKLSECCPNYDRTKGLKKESLAASTQTQ